MLFFNLGCLVFTRRCLVNTNDNPSVHGPFSELEFGVRSSEFLENAVLQVLHLAKGGLTFSSFILKQF